MDFPFRECRRRHRDENFARHPRRRPPLQHAEAYRALSRARRDAAALRAHSAHHEQGRLEDEQAGPGASVDDYIKKGYLPEAVRNYLSLLGWSPKDNREKMSIEETTKIFDLNNVVRSHATFDPDKLHWLNGEYARELGAEEFHDLVSLH